ncbi:Magnesium transporter MRS2/LPE10 [Penicillium hispanicum]|uniref:Magnesium transporter MRS2/LPE10 n=1 Tax=Penicillium hispanicum TaxID=1080232 RepID=UPI00253FC41E|nr:Magnesium transporter MRS2/LPE10 [Penicillium hispanicum]KAJ5577892.1 Magnesium transporter MRS2/LPE10 [Penicillium hispanicum]
MTPGINKRGTMTSAHKSFHIRSESESNHQKKFDQHVFNLSLALSRSRVNDTTELRCTVLDADGAVKSSETRLTKAEVAAQYAINGRDLRNVDLVSEGISHVVVRPSTIFISIFTLRILIQADRVLLFHLDSETPGIQLQDVFLHDLQSRLPAGCIPGAQADLPYELRVVDAALASVTAILEAEHSLIRTEVEQHLRDSKDDDIVRTSLRGLLDNGKRLVTIEQRARQVRSALQELLNNDEDLAAMYLSDTRQGKPHAIEDHQEVEYLLEAYYKNADAIAESSSVLIRDVNRTADVIQSVLDVRRNQIMLFEAQLEVWMLGFAVSTFVAGLFGMNVINYFEESASAFAILVGVCMVGTVVLSRYGMWKLKKFRKLQL